MMKHVKFLVVASLILAVSGTAGALTFKQAYQGEIKFKFSDWEVGRAYLPGPTQTDLQAVGDFKTLTGAELQTAKDNTGSDYFSVPPVAAMNGEDGWGLFQLREILGESAPGQFDVDLWDVDDPSKDVLGIFYGMVDMQVTISLAADPDGSMAGGVVSGDEIFGQTIWAAGDDLSFELYETPDGVLPLDAPTARTAQDAYPGFATGVAADMWMAGDALPDVLLGAPSGAKFYSDTLVDAFGIVNNPSSSPGTARMVLEIDDTIGEGGFYANDPNGEDLIFTTNVYPDLTGLGWTTNTDDPAWGSVIPEPMTMLGVFFGISGLAGYVRKRRRA